MEEQKKGLAIKENQKQDEIDADNDGLISEDELLAYFSKNPAKHSPENVKKCFLELGKKDKGKMRKSMFKYWWKYLRETSITEDLFKTKLNTVQMMVKYLNYSDKEQEIQNYRSESNVSHTKFLVSFGEPSKQTTKSQIKFILSLSETSAKNKVVQYKALGDIDENCFAVIQFKTPSSTDAEQALPEFQQVFKNLFLILTGSNQSAQQFLGNAIFSYQNVGSFLCLGIKLKQKENQQFIIQFCREIQNFISATESDESFKCEYLNNEGLNSYMSQPENQNVAQVLLFFLTNSQLQVNSLIKRLFSNFMGKFNDGLNVLGLGALSQDLFLVSGLHQKSDIRLEFQNFDHSDIESYGLMNLYAQQIESKEFPFKMTMIEKLRQFMTRTMLSELKFVVKCNNFHSNLKLKTDEFSGLIQSFIIF